MSAKVTARVKKSATAPKVASADDSPNERHAHEVDPERKAENLRRLARIQGQIGGLSRMVESERYCPDILLQIDSVQEALRGVSRELLRNHLRHCARAGLAAKDKARADETIDELVELFQRYRR
jgi:DNA-binding FrmR family transcriptional regulator